MSFLRGNYLYIILSALLVVIAFQYSINVGHKKEVERLNNEMFYLENTILTLEYTLDTIQHLRNTESEELSKSREELERINDEKENTIRRVENAYKDGGVADLPLDDGVKRLLDEACKDIRGDTCPAP